MVGQVFEHLSRHSRTTHATAARPYPCMSSSISARKELPTQARLKELFDYDADNGILIWKVSVSSRARAGNFAGSFNKHLNRRVVRVDKVSHYHYRLVYCWHHGDLGDYEVDHIDRDPSNDRIENLRPSTTSQNGANRNLLSNNKSGHTGVSWDTQRQKWFVKIEVRGKQIALGRYDDFGAATAAYKAAALRYFGDFTSWA